MAESPRNGLKTQWEKEKLRVTSNFSFSHSVFKRHMPQTRKNQGLFVKGLTNVNFFFQSDLFCYLQMLSISNGLKVGPLE